MHRLRTVATVAWYVTCWWAGGVAVASNVGVAGERLDPSSHGPGVVETMQDVLARDRAHPHDATHDPKMRNGRQGAWVVPSRRATYHPKSGAHNVVNKWGDTRMGIRFPAVVDFRGAYFAGQAGPGVWARGVRVIGYRAGRETGRTAWLRNLGVTPKWLRANLTGVDRIVIESQAAYKGGGWYALDDLTYLPNSELRIENSELKVLDFEDVPFRTTLTGLGYGGLVWETGTGDFKANEAIHAPKAPATSPVDEPDTPPEPEVGPLNLGTLPDLDRSFKGVHRGQGDSMAFPPDTHGAVGPDHFIEVVNRVFAVYNKQDGSELLVVHLGSFLPGSSGDPRVLFDQHSMRWVVIVSDFDSRIYLAVSLTSDAMGEWFKTSIFVSQGSDSGFLPDYPTLGVDVNGIYVSAFLARTSLFVIDKAPLIVTPPSLGTVTVFRNLPWEGALHPVHTYGEPQGEYLVSRRSGNALRLRRVDPPLTNPMLFDLGSVGIPLHFPPGVVPALGSVSGLHSVGHRLMMSVYRDGSVWTAHTVTVDGRAACRWYEIDPVTRNLLQTGTVSDSVLHYFFPSIMVNKYGGVAMGFSGASSEQYASAYYTGRRSTDPPGEMAAPVLLHAGTAPQNNIDWVGRNRWGDYSYTTLDPSDEHHIWTIQEYAHGTDIWGTWIGVLSLDDCNSNDIRDDCELDCGAASGDCAAATCGEARDCNANGRPDDCDIASARSVDLNNDRIPDECPVPGDFDGDADVDLTDFTGLADCATNGVGELPQQCVAVDFDGNQTVDLRDFGAFQAAHTGDCGVVITQQPLDTAACPNGVAVLTVAAEAETLTYRWYHSGVDVPGASGPTLTVNPVNDTAAGSYTAYAVSACAVARSADVTLEILAPPVITSAPEFAITCVGGSAMFSVSAVGVEPLGYQWQLDGFNIAGENEATITITPAQNQDAGAYRCIVTGACGQSVTSPSEMLLVTPPLEFTLQPAGGTYCVGTPVFLIGSAAGSPDYQWSKDGTPIPGATAPFLVISNVNTDAAGAYRLFASNECESAESNPAVVKVIDCP